MVFKVTNVISSFNAASGGPPRTVALIAQASLGHWRAELFTTNHLQSAHDRLLVKDFSGHVNVLPASAHSMLGGMLRAAPLFRSFEVQLLLGTQPDIVHIHGMWHPLLAAFAYSAQRHRIPYVVAPHGMLEPWALNVRKRRKAMALQSYQGRIIERAAALHATSAQEAESLRRLPCVQCPIFIVPNAVDIPKAPMAGSHRMPSEPRTLLFLSRLHAKKGLDLLLQAWNELRPKSWRLAIVGSGSPDYVETLKRWCANASVPNVQFHGHLDGEQREQIYSGASAFVLPTYSENFGNVVAEALVRGIPVITTTGTPWVALTEWRCGWYVEPKVEALKGALAALFATDATTLRAMGDRGREYASARFSIEAVREALLQLYHAVLGSNRTEESVLDPSRRAAG